MKYTVVQLDGRYSYRQNFEFYLAFANTMTRQQGPLCFNDAITWFTERYGWSAEIRQWHHIERWTSVPGQPRIKTLPLHIASGILAEPSAHCNPYWSWSNTHSDLRIYVAGEQELAFWQLAHPVDQKTQ
jgi:hypothetical protein